MTNNELTGQFIYTTEKSRRKLDMIGHRYGQLVVMADSLRTTRLTRFCICKCDCGNEKHIRAGDLRSGRAKSCGCMIKSAVTKRNTTHGHALTGKCTTEFRAWTGMLSRCYNSNRERYKNYGGRGITVCDRWLTSFENFYSDLGPKPSPQYSLDRIDNNGNYEPSNCHWATKEQQARNKSNTTLLEWEGKQVKLLELCESFGVKIATVRERLTAGWPIKKALLTIPKQFKETEQLSIPVCPINGCIGDCSCAEEIELDKNVTEVERGWTVNPKYHY